MKEDVLLETPRQEASKEEKVSISAYAAPVLKVFPIAVSLLKNLIFEATFLQGTLFSAEITGSCR